MKLKKLCLSIFCSIAMPIVSSAASFDPNFDPKQNITYWLNSVISSENNEHVRQAEHVFSQLLRAWDRTRIPPNLYVVKSNAGAWAASLADGSILLSYEALRLSLKNDVRNQGDKLAFILGHEISHQRADDLWQQKFFRMAGLQSPEGKTHSLRNLKFNEQDAKNLERQESQADADGLVLMSIAGFDPLEIISETGFFTQWAEAVWGRSCQQVTRTEDAFEACKQAQSRHQRAHIKLKDIAAKTTLFELGVQAFVRQDYRLALRYFSAFGRDYPYAVVHENIANSHLALALSFKQKYSWEFEHRKDQLYFPQILAAQPGINKEKLAKILSMGKTRSLSKSQRKKHYLSEISSNLDNAIQAFERAIQIRPDVPGNYLQLALAYMLQKNYFMAKGILHDKYKQKFSASDDLIFYLALVDVFEGNISKAVKKFESIEKKTSGEISTHYLSTALLQYSTVYNLSQLASLEDAEKSTSYWKALTKNAKTSGDSLLFRYALARINPLSIPTNNINENKFKHEIKKIQKKLGLNIKIESEIWLEGERLSFIKKTNGVKYVATSENELKGVWANDIHLSNLLLANDLLKNKSIDRLYKTLGIPARKTFTSRGIYLSYDQLKISFFVKNSIISGWFLHI